MNRTTKALTILSLGILAVVLTFNFLIARANDQAAPDFTLIALDGTEVTLTDFEGKVTFFKINLSNEDIDYASVLERLGGEEMSMAPTFVLVNKNKEVGRLVDEQPYEDFKKKVEGLL